MRFRVALLTVLALLPAAAGCEQKPLGQKTGGEQIVPLVDSISVEQLAGTLKLKIVRQTPHEATLNGGPDSVTVFADPDGAVYVNGRRLGNDGPFLAEDATIYVPAALVDAIRPMLHPRLLPLRPPAPALAHPTRKPPRQEARLVVLDPGHGGKATGAIGCNGLLEKDVVLRVSQMVRARLDSQGVRVVMTREMDEFLELEARPAIANRLKADLFVSIHADSAANRSASGNTVYMSRSPSTASTVLANQLSRSLDDGDSRGVRQADYRVLVCARVPASLVEIGYLSNRGEAARLATDQYLSVVADNIADGILQYFKR